jgi:hypothetical protein
MNNIALEKHYRVKDLATLWGISDSVIRRIFQGEPGVLRIGSTKYVTLSIPESVAIRVHHYLSQPPLRTELSRGSGRTVVHLRDSQAGMTSKARRPVKRYSGQ